MERVFPRPTKGYLIDAVVGRIPLRRPRMRCYRAMGAKLDPDRSTIMLYADILSIDNLVIGDASIVGRHCLLDARGGLRIGSNVNISSYCRFMTAKHDIYLPDFPALYEPITVEDRVWVALGVTVLGGVTIGEETVVAAGSVVTKDVAPWQVVGGVPARPIGDRPKNQTYTLDFGPEWS